MCILSVASTVNPQNGCNRPTRNSTLIPICQNWDWLTKVHQSTCILDTIYIICTRRQRLEVFYFLWVAFHIYSFHWITCNDGFVTNKLILNQRHIPNSYRTRNSWMCVEMSSFIYQTRLYMSQGPQVNWNPFYDSSQLDSSILHQIKLQSVCHILFWCMMPFNRESNMRSI